MLLFDVIYARVSRLFFNSIHLDDFVLYIYFINLKLCVIKLSNMYFLSEI